MASLHKHVYQENGIEKSVLLFVNRYFTTQQHHAESKLRRRQYMAEEHILLDEYSGRGYSCITSMDESTIGIL